MEILEKLIDHGIMGILGFMSIVSLSIIFDRFIYFRKINLSSYDDKRILELELTSKMHILASIGSNAPYIGLLGTVLGIILTFYKIGSSGLMDSGAIMTSLALTMKVTALGLVVAIPSIILYNVLIRKVKVIIVKWEVGNGR